MNLRQMLRHLVGITVLLFYSSLLSAQPDGETLFKQQCASCHATSDQKLVGPGLKGINEKRDRDWLISWIKNSKELIDKGDPEAIAVFEEYNKVTMPPFAGSEADIIAILDYIKAANNPEAAAGDADTGDGEDAKASASAADKTPDESSGFQWSLTLTIILISLLVLIGISLKMYLDAKKVLRKYGYAKPQKAYSFSEKMGMWAVKNRKWLALGVLVLFAFGLKGLWNELAAIGVSQGYKPDQPIAFSHEIHAGQNEISCNYCHSGAKKGAVAGIPSANVCMNCHTYVKEGSVTGTEEISKIYEALDYDPKTMQYGENTKPIEWVQVHNLPDLAYFNHSQHVVVGKLDCQTCHGPVQEMEVVEQHAPLTMGWCVDCHRNTEVKMDGNDYYTKIHEEYKEKYKGQKITVDKIGGLDCARCHY